MGNLEFVKGCCPLDCQDGCGWVATVEAGRVIKVAGARDHPYTRGSLCTKVRDYESRTYAADRLLHPLIRTGPKGSGQFRQASWDEALDLVAARTNESVARHGGETVLPFKYLGAMGVVQRLSLLRLFHGLGASSLGGSVCGAASNGLAAEGHPRGFDPEDMSEARFVLVWGANPVSTSHHSWHFVNEARRRHGARVVVVDPRSTPTARAADEHLAVVPGTDSALAAGIGRVLLAEGLADLEYARRTVADLDAYRAQVEPWTPDRVAAVCGVDATAVLRIGREFGNARPALVRAGVGAQQSRRGEAFVRSLSALALLGGHWQHRGGGLFIESGPDVDERPAARPDLQPGTPRSLDMARLGQVLTDPHLDPPVTVMFVWGANPAVSQPDAARVRQGLERDDLFLVVSEHFLTDTARYADVVLPSTTQLEHVDVQGSWGHHYVQANNQAIAPLGETKSHGEIMRMLAPRLGLAGAVYEESDEQIAASVLPPGVDLATLRERGWIKVPPAAFEPGDDFRPLRIADEPILLPEQRDGQLRLLTPKSHSFLNSTFVNMPTQRRAARCPTLEMNPADAAARGLSDGSDVRILNDGGSVVAQLRITDDTRSGVVCLPGKWWDHDGGIANVLVPGSWAPGGQPAYNDVLVQVIAENHQ